MRLAAAILSVAVLLVGCVYMPTSQDRIGRLKAGVTNRDAVLSLFGSPAFDSKIAESFEIVRNGKRHRYADISQAEAENSTGSPIQKRAVYLLEYPAHQLKVYLVDKPWRVESVEIADPRVEVAGVHVGDSLEKVWRGLGSESAWEVVDDELVRKVVYEEKGLKFAFAAKTNEPISVWANRENVLAEPKRVIFIEFFDNSIEYH